jgi:hypothetical protein
LCKQPLKNMLHTELTTNITLLQMKSVTFCGPLHNKANTIHFESIKPAKGIA